MGTSLYVPDPEIETRPSHEVDGLKDNRRFMFDIDTIEAVPAWQREFLSDTSGEDIVKHVTGLEIEAVCEIVAKARGTKF
jgi:hypothetical protein